VAIDCSYEAEYHYSFNYDHSPEVSASSSALCKTVCFARAVDAHLTFFSMTLFSLSIFRGLWPPSK
jgi:hypothetical protein